MSFEKIEAIKDIDECVDQGTVVALRLRKMIEVGHGLIKTLLASFFAVTPRVC